MSGYVKLYRALWDHPAFRNKVEAAAFCYLFSMAQWRDTVIEFGGRELALMRGQVAITGRKFAELWGWSEVTHRRYLIRLTERRMIDAVSDAHQTIITICNYDKFQALSEEGDALDDAEVTHLMAHGWRTPDAQNNESKKGKKLSPPYISPPTPSEGPSLFRAEEPPPKANGKKRKSIVPSDFMPDANAIAFARDKGNNDAQIEALRLGFINHSQAKGVLYSNFNAGFRTRVLQDIEFHGDPRHRGNGKGAAPLGQPARKIAPAAGTPEAAANARKWDY